MPAYVVAIAGPSGCGKTALAQALAARLDAAVTLHFDDFPCDEPPEPTSHADFDRFRTPELALALERLRRGEPVTLPELSESVGLERSRRVDPAPVIVVEEPFGRLRRDTARLIDFVVCIDVPLHIALARRLERQLGAVGRRLAADRSDVAGALVASIRGFLTHYQDGADGFYSDLLDRLKRTSDRIVDGRRPLAELAIELAAVVSAQGLRSASVTSSSDGGSGVSL